MLALEQVVVVVVVVVLAAVLLLLLLLLLLLPRFLFDVLDPNPLCPAPATLLASAVRLLFVFLISVWK